MFNHCSASDKLTESTTKLIKNRTKICMIYYVIKNYIYQLQLSPNLLWIVVANIYWQNNQEY